jgi:outer membrane autotransporter protein
MQQTRSWRTIANARLVAALRLRVVTSMLDACGSYSVASRLGSLLAAIGFASLAFPSVGHAQAPNLGTAANFAVLAGSTVTNTGPTILQGSLGVSPGSAVTGFPPGIVVAPGGVFVGDAVAVQAQIDLATGYNAAASRPPTADLSGQNLGGLTLTPGVYNFTSAAQLNGVLTLNALGNPNAVFIFNIASTLTTGSSATVTMVGGGRGSNVYWRVGSSATLGTTTSFIGDILALTSITLNTGANIMCGSALARNGAVTLDTNNILIGSLPVCAMAALLIPGAQGSSGAAGALAAINIAFANAFGPGGAGNFPPGFLALAGLSPALQASALQQLAGELSTAVAPSGIMAMNSFLSLVLNPYAGDNRSGFGPAPRGLIVKTLGYAPDQRMPNRTPAYGSIDRAIAAADFDPRRWSIWGAAYGDQSRIGGSADLGTHDLTAQTYGFATGVDYRVLPNTIIGFSLGGGATNFGLSDGLGGGHMDMFQAAVYSSTRIGAAYVSAALAYAWYDTTTNQYLSVPNADRLTAHFAANDVGGRIEGGYRFAVPVVPDVPDIGVTPYGAVQAQAFHTPSYSENATSDFARSFGASTTTAIRTELGAWVDQAYRLNAGTVLILRGRAAWAHDFVSEPPINVGFLALPGSAFTVEGATLPRDLALVTASAEIRWQNGFSIAAQFNGAFADNAFQYGGSGRVRYSW